MEEKTYELIEHTADIGIRVKGKDLKELFQYAALALFQLSCEKIKITDVKETQITIKQKADNLDELFVNWLNELLSLSAAKGLVFEQIVVTDIDEKSLEAVATADSIENYKVNTEIKAATYHELRISKTWSGWQAQVILDV